MDRECIARIHTASCAPPLRANVADSEHVKIVARYAEEVEHCMQQFQGFNLAIARNVVCPGLR